MNTTPHARFPWWLLVSVHCFLLLAFSSSVTAEDWPMLGRDQTRNSVSPEKNAPVEWDVKTGRNVKWQARIGSLSFAAPVVAKGLVWIGTNNEYPRDPGQTNLAGVLMCFLESNGEFLYQHVSPARQGPTYRQTWSGISGSPLIEGDRLWFVNTSAEVFCLDIGPPRRGEGKPVEVWKLDMMSDEFNVLPRPAVMGGGGICSIAVYRDLIYVITGNGTDWTGINVPSPKAPALLCLNKDTGKVVWEDESPGTNILFGEWGSPLVVEIEGRGQVIAPQGDGWIRSFDARTGKLIWEFDINPKSARSVKQRYSHGGPGFFSTAPVFYGNRIYITIGNYREFGEFPGRLVCLDPTKEGDISLELDDGPGKGKPNPNVGAVWHFDRIQRTMAAVAIHEGLVIAPDFGGYVHCLDAETGKTNWIHDMRAHVLGSALIVDDRVFVADEDGDINVLALAKEKRLLTEASFEGPIYSAPIFANGVMYVVAGEMLYAIEEKSPSWPQWRGPDRSNRSSETGLLQSWPTNGPPLVWKATGLGEGIASVSVASQRLYTVGYRDGGEFVFALDAQTGEGRWSSRVGEAVKESAQMRWLSQRTPTVDEDRLYTMTAGGELICLQSSDGRELWRKSYPKDFASPRPMWGFADRPLVDGDKLVCAPAGTNASVVALNKRTGEVIWCLKLPGEVRVRESYAATLVSEVGGIRQYVAFLGGGLAGIEAKEGRLLWRYAGTSGNFGNSYTPIIQGNQLFSANGYGGGMALLKLVRAGDGITAQEQYHHSFSFNPFQDATVLVDEHVYAFQSAALPVCIEMKSGLLAWGPVTNAIKGRTALTYADGHLYLRGANGVMLLVAASPRSYVEKGSFLIPDREEALGVTSPVVAGGRLYLRDSHRLLCYDISADAFTKPKTETKTIAISLTPAQTQAEAGSGTQTTGKYRAPDAIYVPTPGDVVEKMLELAEVKKENLVVDLGSGDGRIVIAAAKKYGSKAVGYELDERLIQESRANVVRSRVEPLVRIEHEDIFAVDLIGADVVAVYLPSPLLERLLPQLAKLRPGSRIVSHQFEIPGFPPHKTLAFQSQEDGDMHRLHLWIAPLKKAGQ